MEALEATAAVQTSCGVRCGQRGRVRIGEKGRGGAPWLPWQTEEKGGGGTYHVGSGQIVEQRRHTAALSGRRDGNIEHALATLIGFLERQIANIGAHALL